MDKYSKQLNDYLLMVSRSSLLVSQGDRQNMQVLITMLGPLDEDIIDDHFGLFGHEALSDEDNARKHGTTPQAIQLIVEKDLRRLAITPEWQMLLRQLSPLVRKQLHC